MKNLLLGGALCLASSFAFAQTGTGTLTLGTGASPAMAAGTTSYSQTASTLAGCASTTAIINTLAVTGATDDIVPGGSGSFGGRHNYNARFDTPNEKLTFTITFGRAVSDVSFRLFNVDRTAAATSPANFQDRVVVTSNVGNPSSITNVQAWQQVVGANTVQGTNNGNSTLANQPLFTFAGPITSITIVWDNGPDVPAGAFPGGYSGQTIGIGDMAFSTGCNGPAPVTWANFSGKYSDNSVSLSWQTSSEQNNDRFEVERSSDAQTFERIGSVAGKGTSTQKNDYVFVDENVTGETAYYRLKQVDTDGKFEYSRTISVALGSESIVAYPNPANEKILVSGDVSRLTLLDVSGKTLRESSNNEMGLSGLASGVFLLKIKETSGAERTQKVVKQ